MISKEEVLNLATLARLEISDAEVATLQKDISSILDYVGAVSKIETGEGTVSPGHRNILRADTPREATHPLMDKEEVLQAAFPKHEGAYNVVRKIIQKDE